MGHHFVPQRYLRNFEDPSHPGYIWVHDRHGGEAQLANIAKVAQSRDFYSQSTETILAETVERPANLVIQKLTTRQPITTSGTRPACVLRRGHDEENSCASPAVFGNVA